MKKVLAVAIVVGVLSGCTKYHSDHVVAGIYHFDDIINQESYYDFKCSLKNKEFKVVELNSDGGRIAEALKIGKLIHDNHLAVTINPGDQCSSACAYLYAAGWTRKQDGLLCIHSPALAGKPYRELYGKDLRLVDNQLNEVRFSLEDWGVDSGFVNYTLETPNKDITCISNFAFNLFVKKER